MTLHNLTITNKEMIALPLLKLTWYFRDSDLYGSTTCFLQSMNFEQFHKTNLANGSTLQFDVNMHNANDTGVHEKHVKVRNKTDDCFSPSYLCQLG